MTEQPKDRASGMAVEFLESVGYACGCHDGSCHGCKIKLIFRQLVQQRETEVTQEVLAAVVEILRKEKYSESDMVATHHNFNNTIDEFTDRLQSLTINSTSLEKFAEGVRRARDTEWVGGMNLGKVNCPKCQSESQRTKKLREAANEILDYFENEDYTSRVEGKLDKLRQALC